MTPPMLRLARASDFERWLEQHHDRTPEGVWLELAKKGAPFTTVSYAEAVELALCFGWIDGQKGSVGPMSWRQRFTPRRSRSVWSKVNREKADALIASGRMRASGLAEVERARADGRWARAYDSPKQAQVPEDLKQALSARPAALLWFEALDATNRYAVLHRIATAVRPDTRQRRIEGFVDDLEQRKAPWPDRLPAAPASKGKPKRRG